LAIENINDQKRGDFMEQQQFIEGVNNDEKLEISSLIADPTIEVRNLNLWYGTKQALNNISFGVGKNKATAFIGPSGCGKSTLIRCFNRLNELLLFHKISSLLIIYVFYS